MLGNPSLRRPCDPVADLRTATGVSADLRDTLLDLRRRFGFGRGLAAPQIGYRLRVVTLVWPADLTLVNPRVLASEGEQWVWDDCFSIPGLVMRVRRARTVTVAYTDQQGEPAELQADGPAAELLQHEIDHLDGILALDRVEAMTDVMMREEWERQESRGV